MINTCTVVSVDDREDRSKGPPFELLVQGFWTLYLGFSVLKQERGTVDVTDTDRLVDFCTRSFLPFAILCSKIALKYYAYEKARRSYALGRNPGLIFVYMQQQQARDQANPSGEPPVGEDNVPPPALLIMGEEEKHVEKHPYGYAFKDDPGTTLVSNVGLVTIHRVWQLDNMLPMPRPQEQKDLCFSFALFKLLRCRFARYKLTNVGSIFFRSLFLKVGEHDRAFRVIADELSFLHDYYYSSLPISYSQSCLPMLSIFLSLLSVGYCIYFTVMAILEFPTSENEILCSMWCIKQPLISLNYIPPIYNFDAVPLLLVLVVVIAAELRDMASYICSNWTKVTLICRYVIRASSQHSLRVQKWVTLLLKSRCKLMKHWDEEMRQCSVLVPQQRTSPLVLVRRLLRLPDQKRKVKVPARLSRFASLTR